ncbi:hypothetical protein BMS3Abin03_00260 [bacterium BMS3Abin03]|nr:hypothetical protein BMS3Abin03_00260 [bacterium BMS3Abin03]
MKKTTGSAADGKGSLGKIINNEESADDLNRLSESLNNITGNMNSDSTFAGRFFNDKKGC